MTIPAQRLARQLITKQPHSSPAEVVAWLGAIQAQDYLAALWALGLRTAGANESTIEAAIADGSVIRTHVFRFTWQYVAREDLRWMLGLVGSRVIGSAAGRFRDLELDGKTLKRCGDLFARALSGGNQLTRVEMAEVLAKGKVKAVNLRLLHILGHAELDGVICSGGRRGKQSTFALLDDRVPKQGSIFRDEALQRIALRYFRSRGPASERDFSWWTGLNLSESRLAIELAGKELEKTVLDGRTFWHTGAKARSSRASAYLLPAFDEYLVGYTDRSAVSDIKHLGSINVGNGILNPIAVLDGQVVGTWRRTLEKKHVAVAIKLFQSLSVADRGRLTEATNRYGKFLRLEPKISFKR